MTKPFVFEPERMRRECSDCRKDYIASSRTQKRCADCALKRKHARNGHFYDRKSNAQ